MHNEFWETGSFSGDVDELAEDNDGREDEDIPHAPSAAEAQELAKRMERDLANGIDWKVTFVPNPKSRGRLAEPKASWARYETYRSSTTFSQAVANGWHRTGRFNDQKNDIHKGYVACICPRAAAAVQEDFDVEADDGGKCYEQWLNGRLKILPKKGDLGLCKNWRAICLLDVASKVLSSVLVSRMRAVMEHICMEAQAGFRAGRGTIDGLFNILLGLRKRQEHNIETWAVFIDLVKVFDTVPRKALFEVLSRYGLPDHFMRIVMRLHVGAKVNVKIGKDDIDVESNIGVRQGACEGPILFLFIMQAAFETMDWPVAKPTFATSTTKCKTHGEAHDRKIDHENGTTSLFEFWCALFADDCCVMFETRQDMIQGMDYLCRHLRKFGLQMHLGKDGQESKTKAMHLMRPGEGTDEADQSEFNCVDGVIPFAPTFRYLGSLFGRTLDSDTDVDDRIRQASAAFGALRVSTFSNKDIKLEVKGRIFVALILSILLYGSECWLMTEVLRRRLTTFFNRCIRSMCRVNLRTTRKHLISSRQLRRKLNIQGFDFYYQNRFLRWAGHVARMDNSRLPKKFLSSWVQHPRPVGAPRMTFGRTLEKALKMAGISKQWAVWTKMAKAEHGKEWRRKTRGIRAIGPDSES